MNRGSGSGLSVIEMPDTDFSKFGPVKKQALSKIQKLSGRNLHRNWVTIPHVTQFSEADITEMEVFREAEKEALAKQGVRLTPLVFLMKAAVAALKEFPRFNSSLASSGDELVMKSYYHIGVAVDTQNGLVVPVIRDVDKKGLIELARELAAISQKARETGLSMAEMQGGSFTISSLGGIGGTAFTPIINAPEVAIMGVSRTQVKPVWINEKWVARSMLPLSLSYDHRVIDGADGARFVTYFAACLQDLRKLLM
jgi:pyruvate dehydrogenase E2 component (dihydrolipoamide acetyltransferase)